MTGQILVALESQDRLDQMIPYIEEIAQPGMEVVFLVRFAPMAVSRGSQDNCSTLKPLEEIRFVGELEEPRFTDGKMKATRSLEDHTGSLSRVVKSYTRKGNVRLIMKRAGKAMTTVQFLGRIFSFLGLFKQPTLSPVLLLHPDHAV